MIKDLYAALLAPQDWIRDEKITATFNRLHNHSQHLKIDVFEIDQQLIGYAILFDFWYKYAVVSYHQQAFYRCF